LNEKSKRKKMRKKIGELNADEEFALACLKCALLFAEKQ